MDHLAGCPAETRGDGWEEAGLLVGQRRIWTQDLTVPLQAGFPCWWSRGEPGHPEHEPGKEGESNRQELQSGPPSGAPLLGLGPVGGREGGREAGLGQLSLGPEPLPWASGPRPSVMIALPLLSKRSCAACQRPETCLEGGARGMNRRTAAGGALASRETPGGCCPFPGSLRSLFFPVAWPSAFSEIPRCPRPLAWREREGGGLVTHRAGVIPVSPGKLVSAFSLSPLASCELGGGAAVFH